MESQPVRNYRGLAIAAVVIAFIISATALSYYSSFGKVVTTTPVPATSTSTMTVSSPRNQTTFPQTSNVVVCTQTTTGGVVEVSVTVSDNQTYTVTLSSYTDILGISTTTLTTSVTATIGHVTKGSYYPTCTYVEP